MGMYTNVEIEPDLLPDDCKPLTGWQTKDVVRPYCETIRISSAGLTSDFYPSDELRYTGEAWIYTFDDDDDSLTYVVANFLDGELVDLKKWERSNDYIKT
jgi:hypothetical protein